MKNVLNNIKKGLKNINDNLTNIMPKLTREGDVDIVYYVKRWFHKENKE